MPQEYLELAQRKQAEFENFRKRMQRAVAPRPRCAASRKLAKELLAPLDHLGARASSTPTRRSREPLESLRREFLGALGARRRRVVRAARRGLRPEPARGDGAGPVEGAESGTVAEVYQAGYRVGDTVLRPARVVVAA